MIKYPSKSTNKTGFPVPISADYGVRFKMDDRVYLGYELGVGYVGYHSFKVNQMSASQNLFQGDILAVLNLFINPYFELHTKAGFAVQANYFTGNSVYAPNFTFGLGMGIYVDSEMEVTLDTQTTLGRANDYPYQSGTVQNTQILIGIKNYF